MLIFIYSIYSRQNFIHSINSENHDRENDSNNCLKRKKRELKHLSKRLKMYQSTNWMRAGGQY